MNYDSIILRRASEEFEALRVADTIQGIEGADVISIVLKEVDVSNEQEPEQVWYVFAKYDAEHTHPGDIDRFLEHAGLGDADLDAP